MTHSNETPPQGGYQKILFPSQFLSPYIEAYYITFGLKQDRWNIQFPSTTSSFIKCSSDMAVVIGQTTEPTFLEGEFSHSHTGFAVKLRLGALHTLFNIPACEMTNQVIRLDDVLEDVAPVMMESIAANMLCTTHIQIFEQALLRYIKQNDHTYHVTKQAIICLQQTHSATISQIACELGYSTRQLQRKINSFVGVSPSLFRRISRFEKALRLIRLSDHHSAIDWPDVALACGYSDQSHFIREFHEFAGHTPTAYLTSSHISEV